MQSVCLFSNSYRPTCSAPRPRAAFYNLSKHDLIIILNSSAHHPRMMHILEMF